MIDNKKLNPWFSQLGGEVWEHALTGFFPASNPSQDAVMVWPTYLGFDNGDNRRITLGIKNSRGIDRTGDDQTASWRTTFEMLDVVPKVVAAPFKASTGNTIAGTITLNSRLGDIFLINDVTTLNNTSKPYQITVTNLGQYGNLGRSLVLKVNLATGISLKFGGNIILDTSDGSDYSAGEYCITFANTDITCHDSNAEI